MKDQFIATNKEQKNENKNTANDKRYFLKTNFVGVNRLLVLVYSNQDAGSKRYKTWRYYFPKCIRQTGQGKDYTTGCLLDYS